MLAAPSVKRQMQIVPRAPADCAVIGVESGLDDAQKQESGEAEGE